MHTPLNRRTCIALIAAAVVILLAVTGLVIGVVNTLNPVTRQAAVPTAVTTAKPHTSVSPSNSAAPPTTIPDLSRLTLTKEGWVPVPKTRDPRLFGAAAAAALWSYDTRHTTRETTLQHFSQFGMPVANYWGDRRHNTPEQRMQLLYNRANAQVKAPADFVGLQTDGAKVTAAVVAVRSDSQLSTWTDIPELSHALQMEGIHTITTTLNVQFSGTAAGGDSSGDDSEQVIITVDVKCDMPDGYCGASDVESTPEL
jgi:hypothetical protein